MDKEGGASTVKGGNMTYRQERATPHTSVRTDTLGLKVHGRDDPGKSTSRFHLIIFARDFRAWCIGHILPDSEPISSSPHGRIHSLIRSSPPPQPLHVVCFCNWRVSAFGRCGHLIGHFGGKKMTTALLFLSTALDDNTVVPNSTEAPWTGDGGSSYLFPFPPWLIPVILGILICVGMVGNSLVIFVIVRASQRTVTNYYIVNLAVADILFLAFCAPKTANDYLNQGFTLGRFMCKVVLYLQYVTSHSTCFLLAAMSVDRFQAIVRPLKSLKTRTLQTAITISVLVWLSAFLLYIPFPLYFDLQELVYQGTLTTYCLISWPSGTLEFAYTIMTFLFPYALPLVVIAVCYTVMLRHLWQRVAPSDAVSGPANTANTERNLRQKRKITLMVLTVVIVFTVCWFPLHFYSLWSSFGASFVYTNHALNLKTAGHVLSYVNSCANPFIYAFLGENFRKSFRKAFPCCFKRARADRDEARRGVTGANQGSTLVAGPSTRTGSNTQMSSLPSRVDIEKLYRETALIELKITEICLKLVCRRNWRKADNLEGKMTTAMMPYRFISTAEGNGTLTSFATSPPESDTTSNLAYLTWLMPVIFSILITVGVVGNTLVIYVIIKASKRTVTNYYIVNLAASDILFLAFCAPPTAAHYTAPAFYFGRFMCKTVYYLQLVTAQATCFLLTAMSVDRFHAIVRPLKSLRTRTLQMAVLISVSIWLFALIIYIPVLIFFDIEYIDFHGVEPYCTEHWPSKTWNRCFVVVSFVLVFSLPLAAIAVCYGAMIRHLWKRVVPNDALSGQADAVNTARSLMQKRRITWMVLAVVVVFAVCWFPIHVVNMWHRLDPNFPFTDGTFYFKTVGHVMSYCSSCANPFIYAFLGANFRRSFRKAIPCCFRQAGLQTDGRGGTTGSPHGSMRVGASSRGARASYNNTEMSDLNSKTTAK
ncbi:uncharacterized protein LOC110982564 [Acanthaster planci]|uniref:Uncharacterized protein LOC110982564 n=1 Tax=Acanthaster planci TaxID=133434 RepID=A0A8B7YVM9_ACAPL|nr:uncharacterized protein LOC110982564 [Acanthaster planci]